MLIKEAKLSTSKPSYPFKYNRARSFQSEFLEWLNKDKSQTCVLSAPTGSGKTAVFSEICNLSDQTLLIYPTNALLEQQKKVLKKEFNISSKTLKGDKLKKHDHERVRELLQFAERFTGDVVLTNPDILQTIIQNRYYDLTSEAMEFFNKFDGVVYDEFHFYDDFEASGLLMQIKIISERVPESRIVLSSATPKKNKALVKCVEDLIDSNVQRIDAQYSKKGDKFRFDTEVKKHEESLWEKKEKVIDKLKKESNRLPENDGPKMAMVFNSAAKCNIFYTHIIQNTDLDNLTEKDNGYDTKQSKKPSLEDCQILLTTNKGEVGLDYDIRSLFMDKPYNASSFIQRFGRAGRKNTAKVNVFRMGETTWWKDKISYPRFVENIYSTLPSDQTNSEKLKKLSGLRAAHAVASRDEQDNIGWYSEVYEDFKDFPHYDKWSNFIKGLNNIKKKLDEDSLYHCSKDFMNLMALIDNCLEALYTLRGRSLNYDIEYPRGDKHILTSYDLLSVLSDYKIESVDNRDKTVKVNPKNPGDKTSIKVKLPGYEKRYKSYSGPLYRTEKRLQQWINKEIGSLYSLKGTISKGDLSDFFSLIEITRSALPKEIAYDRYDFKVDLSGNSPEISIERS